MAKPERGLPKGFDIRVPKEPVELGDYLDDEPKPNRTAVPPAAPPATATQVAPPPNPAIQVPATPPLPQPTVAAQAPPTPTVAPPQATLPSPPVMPVAPPPTSHVSPFAPAAAFTLTPAPPPAPPIPARQSTKGKQRQFNMAPDAIRMLEEVLVHMRANSAERDLRASEVMHGLVLALHAAAPFMDLSRIPARGKWGSATAANLPYALKEMFEAAIARKR